MFKAIVITVVSFVMSLVLCVTVLVPFLKKHDPEYQKATAPVPTVTVTHTVTPTPSTTESPVEKTPEESSFGDTFQYPEGLLVTVSLPRPYPKDPTIKMKRKYYELFVVKVKNTTNETLPRVEDWFVGSDAGELTKAEGTGTPGGQLAPGKTLTFTVVFGYDSRDFDVSFASCPLWEVCEPHSWS